MKSKSSFPEVDLRKLLITWEKCFSVKPGVIEAETIDVMEANQWDFAPVFDRTTTPELIGLIPRTRLGELNSNFIELSADDDAIVRPEIQYKIRMDELLERMRTTLANIVVNSNHANGKQALGLFTRADLNRHPFRAEIYFSLAHLESELAQLIRRTFDDPWHWLDLLSEEKQARIVGYWEISKRRGVDHGAVSAAMLTEMLQIVTKSDPLRKLLGYESKKLFKNAIGRIPDLRNQIMHPVRPLIVDEATVASLQSDLRTTFDMLGRLRQANRELKVVPYKRILS